MNVPNRYKGFSKLPENVQQRMDPSLAKKYQMGGSVMQRPLFRQMGGPAQMMPQDMPPPPMGGAPMAPPPMPPPPVDPMAEQMMAAENMGQSAGEDVANAMMMQIDGAEDYESLIDGIRGNELPLDARYQELAGFVGEADAMATPESVLAMTQPTIMMTEQGAVDSGIGELMQGIAGEVDMSGPMDDGVGSLMAAGAGNTPPVNFRNGGPVEVRGYDNGGVIEQAKRDTPAYYELFAGDDAATRAAQLEEQRKMSQAQMLFDIAGAGLAFAGETQGGTAAERLANALTRTQLTDKIGARSADLLKSKTAQQAEDRQTRLAATQAALSGAQSKEQFDREMSLLKAKPKTAKMMNIVGADGILIDSIDAANDYENYKKILMDNPGAQAFTPGSKQAANLKFVTVVEGESFTRVPYDVNVNLAGYTKALKAPNAYSEIEIEEQFKIQGEQRDQAADFQTVGIPPEGIVIDGKTILPDKNGTAVLSLLDIRKAYNSNQPLTLDPEFITDKDVFNKFGLRSMEAFLALDTVERKIMQGFAPRYKIQEITDKTGTRLVRINLDDPNDVVDMATYDPVGEGKWFTFNYIGDNGELVETVQDLSTKEGQALMEIVNKQNDPNRGGKLGSAGMLKIGTENLTPQSYITNDGKVITSYDNRSFVDPSDGKVKQLTSAGAVALRDSNVYEIMKKSQISQYAEKELKDILGVSDLDETAIYTSDFGQPLPEDEQSELRKLIDKELKYLSGVKTTQDDIKKGTGLVSNFLAVLNNVGGSIAPKTFNKIFGNTAAARASVARFNVLAISALSVNPGLRVSNLEMDKVKAILPDPKRILTNVDSEAERFQETVNLLRQQRLILLDAIQSKNPLAIGPETAKQTLSKLRELNKILSLVRADKGDRSMTLQNALTATDDIDTN